MTLAYDGLNRPLSQGYAGAGGDILFAYDQGPNGIGRLSRITDREGTDSFAYDGLNRLIRVEKAGATVATYGYDSANRRISKTTAGVTTHYLYDLGSQLIAETLADGTVLREYIYLDGEPMVLKEYQTNPGTYYFINDHLGTPQQLITATGAIVWQAAYLPFGQAQIKTATVANNLRFPGQYFDAETGLHYNWNRYYDPEVGRYITADPIGLDGGMNLYAYVGGNPINSVDPNGFFSTTEAIGHYFSGGGLEIMVNFSEVDIGLQPTDFTGYTALVNSMYKREGTVPVDLKKRQNLGGWAGNQTYRLKGTITSTECEWKFFGYIGAFDNPFDFNRMPWGERGFWAEVITRDIGFYGPMLGGQDYNITFLGHRQVQDGGKW